MLFLKIKHDSRIGYPDVFIYLSLSLQPDLKQHFFVPAKQFYIEGNDSKSSTLHTEVWKHMLTE